MPDILIRDVPPEILKSLKKKAAENRRSLQQELLLIIENAAGEELFRAADSATMVRERLQAYGKEYTDSANLIRADRDR